jgi:hypothetical protein
MNRDDKKSYILNNFFYINSGVHCMNNFDKVKLYLADLGLPVIKEDKGEELVIVTDQSQGINNLVIDCEDPILIMEQFVFKFSSPPSSNVLLRLLQINRDLVHGAFVIDDTGNNVIFRDTLQLGNLDKNELEGSINALSLAMAEYSLELIEFAKL